MDIPPCICRGQRITGVFVSPSMFALVTFLLLRKNATIKEERVHFGIWYQKKIFIMAGR